MTFKVGQSLGNNAIFYYINIYAKKEVCVPLLAKL